MVFLEDMEQSRVLTVMFTMSIEAKCSLLTTPA